MAFTMEFSNRTPSRRPLEEKDGNMKLLIAFAAVLSSAALTVPTVADISGSDSEARQTVALAAPDAPRNNA